MQSLLYAFIPIAIIFLVIYTVYALLRTLFSRPRAPISRFDLILVFGIVLTPFAALVIRGMEVNRISGVSDTMLRGAIFVLAGILLASGLLITLLEALRPPRLRGSRGILMLGGALLMGVSTAFVPYIAEYIGVDAMFAASPVAFNTPVNFTPANAAANSGGDSPATATPPAGTLDATQIALATQEYFRPIFEELFNDIYAIIGRETGLDLDAILTALDKGQSIAQLVQANDGDMEVMIADITARLRETIVSLAQQGIIPRGQAALFLSQLEFAVRLSVENDVRTLLDRFGGGQQVEADSAGVDAENSADTAQGTANGTNESLFAFLTVTATPTGSNGDIAALASPSLTPLPILPSTPINTPSPSRTPRPTATPTNTRAVFVRPTATETPTLPSPCVAVMNYNVNMRREPDLEAELVVTIPYETAVTLFGRDEDSEWWFAEYEGEGGWIKGEFITTTASCEKLPVRR